MKLRSIERMMTRCFKEFPFGGFRMTQYIPELGGNLQECEGVIEKVWE